MQHNVPSTRLTFRSHIIKELILTKEIITQCCYSNNNLLLHKMIIVISFIDLTEKLDENLKQLWNLIADHVVKKFDVIDLVNNWA